MGKNVKKVLTSLLESSNFVSNIISFERNMHMVNKNQKKLNFKQNIVKLFNICLISFCCLLNEKIVEKAWQSF